MKNSIKYIVCAAAVAMMATSCYKQDDIYKQYVQLGGYDYPAKPMNVSAIIGYNRVFINWEKPMDPAVRTAKLYWDNYAESVDINYADYPDGKVSYEVTNLEDHSYTFDIVNFDKNNNRSLPTEITVSPKSESWLVSRSPRTFRPAIMVGANAEVEMTKNTDEMLWTQIRFKTKDGKTDDSIILGPEENSAVMKNALQGKYFQYRFCYRASNCIDSVWTKWTNSPDAIAYALNPKRWTVTATKGQVFGENAPSKIFDGIKSSGCSWLSSRSDASKDIFPKILAIDTKAADGEEFTFTHFNVCQSTEGQTYRYVKNFNIYAGPKPYDPDTKDYVKDFGMSMISASLGISEAEQVVTATQGKPGRYLAVAFLDSYSEDNFVCVWELEPFGYVAKDASVEF